MLLNYMLTAWRSLTRDRLYTAINLLGLSLGIAAILLLSVHAHRELTYDTFHDSGENIYRLMKHFESERQGSVYASSNSMLVGEGILEQTPGVKRYARMLNFTTEISHGEVLLSRDVLFTDPALLDMFDIPGFGGGSSVLPNDESIVITPAVAREYFGDEDPVGKLLVVNLRGVEVPYTVTAVIPEMPGNSVISYELIASIDKYRARTVERLAPYLAGIASGRGMTQAELLDIVEWYISYGTTWVELLPGASVTDAEGVFYQLVHGENATHRREDDSYYDLYLQPLRNVHLTLSQERNWKMEASLEGLLILAGISLLILILAAINFTTLALSRSYTRLREVGVRKVMGAGRWALRGQFLAETALLMLFASILGVGIAELSAPYVGGLFGQDFTFQLSGTTVLVMLTALTLIVALAGGWPAIVLARVSAMPALKGEVKIGRKALSRRLLVGFQLSTSLLLIVLAIVMLAQFQFVQTRDLGYNHQQIVALAADSNDNFAEDVHSRLRSQFTPSSGVVEVSAVGATFGPMWHTIMWELEDGSDSPEVAFNYVDESFLDVAGVKPLLGRNFDAERPSDRTESLLVNEAFVEMMGWESPLGQTIPNAFGTAQVVGVVPDFHYEKLYEPVRPLVMVRSEETLRDFKNFMVEQPGEGFAFLLASVAPGETDRALRSLERAWSESVSEQPLDMTFVDSEIDKQYREDRRWAKLVLSATALALTIALIGLIGLAVLQVNRRTREIGIRKVLGASLNNILLLLSREMIVLVGIGTLVGGAGALYVAQLWLEQFAFRISLTPLYVLAGGVMVLTVAVVSVSLFTLQAANRNPVDTLRTE